MDDFLQKLKNGWFSAKLKKVVRIVLYGPAISQSDCRKTGPYQLPLNNTLYSVSNKMVSIKNFNSDLFITFIQSF